MVRSPIPFSCFSERLKELGADVVQRIEKECRSAPDLAKQFGVTVADIHEALDYLRARNIAVVESDQDGQLCYGLDLVDVDPEWIKGLTLGEMVDLGILAQDDAEEYARRLRKYQACRTAKRRLMA